MSRPLAHVGVPSPSCRRRLRCRQVAIRHAQRQSVQVLAILAVCPDTGIDDYAGPSPLHRETLLHLCPRLRLGHRIILALEELIPSTTQADCLYFNGSDNDDFDDSGDVGVSGFADCIYFNGHDNEVEGGDVNGTFGNLDNKELAICEAQEHFVLDDLAPATCSLSKCSELKDDCDNGSDNNGVCDYSFMDLGSPDPCGYYDSQHQRQLDPYTLSSGSHDSGNHDISLAGVVSLDVVVDSVSGNLDCSLAGVDILDVVV